MKKLIRYGLLTLAFVVGVIVLAWVLLSVYVGMNEDRLIKKIATGVEERTAAHVSIGGLGVSLLRTFPIPSLDLMQVSLQDSQFATHQKDLLKAKDVYLRLSLPALIAGGLPIGQVIIADGQVNIFTDSAGYTNEYLLHPEKKPAEQPKRTSLPAIVLKNMLITYSNSLRNKLHQGVVSRLKCSVSETPGAIRFGIHSKMLVRSLAFNTQKGSYLKDKMLEGDFTLIFDKSKKDLLVKNVRLDIGNHPYYFNGRFHIDKLSPDFNLSITTQDADFTQAASLLNDSIRHKMNQYAFTEPVRFEVDLSGKTLYRFIPLVKVAMEVKKNKVSTSRGLFEDCTFKAFFINEKVSGKPRVDENSVIEVRNFSGRWENIPITSRSATISNLIHPFLECDLASDIDMQSFNRLAGSRTVQFLKGNTVVHILFKGPIDGRDSVVSSIDGEVKISNAEIKYLPRDLLLSDCSGTLQFDNNNLVVAGFTARAGQTKLVMSGDAENFLSLINVSPEKLVMRWKIFSPNLRLSDFKGFLTKPVEDKTQSAGARFRAASARIDKMFTDGIVYVSLQSPNMGYKNFHAAAVKAEVVLKSNEIILQQGFFSHAHGSMSVSGRMVNGVKNNPVFLQAAMKSMDVPILFAAFGNFGQDAVTHENLKGTLTADVSYSTAISNNAEVLSDSSKGTVHFLLENGELNNFTPLLEIGKKAFKKQDFSHIRFADLQNTLDIRGAAVIINPMEIRSTALNFFVQGVYDFKKGSDISIRLPLNNLTRSQADTDLSDRGKIKKGIILRLRAQTGEDGKLNISWDPFRRSVKNKKDVRDSANEDK